MVVSYERTVEVRIWFSLMKALLKGGGGRYLPPVIAYRFILQITE